MIVGLQKKNKIQLPDELMEKLQWKVADTILVSEQPNGTIVLKKVVEFTPGDVVETDDKNGPAVVLASHVSEDEYDQCVVFFLDSNLSMDIAIERCKATGKHFVLPWLKVEPTEISAEEDTKADVESEEISKVEEKVEPVEDFMPLPVEDKAEIKEEKSESKESFEEQELEDVYDLFS